MEKPKDQSAIMMNRLQEREKEQILTLSICSALSQALSRAEFNTVVNGLLKEYFHFDDFIFASSSKNETEYQIFHHFLQQTSEEKSYAINDGFFNACLDSAELVFFDLKSIDKKNSFPDYIINAKHIGYKKGIGIGLPCVKGNKNVLFLFFKKETSVSRESRRIIRGIAMQLSITVGNIMTIEEYENKISELTILKGNLEKSKAEALNIKSDSFHGIVGNSDAMQKVYELIAQVAPSKSTVLISGETGTGKELIANAIHNLSVVSNKTMIKVNCASIPANLIESELFGHEKGAFTGATELRIGKFEQAENSTIFFDEIGELPLELQGKLLRVLQEKEIQRIGGNKTIQVNARIIAATNRILEKEVAEDRFRSDLYYRINVYQIPLPALRERHDDIAVLGNFFLERHSKKMGKKIKGFSKKVLNSMYANAWPGNVRELENMVERSILFAKDDIIKEMFFSQIFITDSSTNEAEFYSKTLHEVEKEYILKVVKKCKGRISGPQGAAVLLDLPGTTLISKMKKLGIKKEYFLD